MLTKNNNNKECKEIQPGEMSLPQEATKSSVFHAPVTILAWNESPHVSIQWSNSFIIASWYRQKRDK